LNLLKGRRTTQPPPHFFGFPQECRTVKIGNREDGEGRQGGGEPIKNVLNWLLFGVFLANNQFIYQEEHP